MKKDFHELTQQQQAVFQPVLYMILWCECDEIKHPEEWMEPGVDEKGLQIGGCLVPTNADEPAKLYEYDQALKYIALTVLNDTAPLRYKLVPVYTGLEHLMEPKVMIFEVTTDGTITPCKEWPKDDHDPAWTPLCSLYGVYEVDTDDPEYKDDYTISIFSKERAKLLIREQGAANEKMGHKAHQYFTVPVGFAPDPVYAVSPERVRAHAKRVMSI